MSCPVKQRVTTVICHYGFFPIKSHKNTQQFMCIHFPLFSVAKSHQRRGIARQLKVISMENAKCSCDCNGVLAEATAHSTQCLFEKLGFQVLKVAKHGDFDSNLLCEDGTNCVKVVFSKLM